MKAVVCTELGDPNLLEIKEVDKPSVSKDEVLVKVEVAGVNFPDALLVQGRYQIVIDPPFIPGNEVCGIVEEIGENVELPLGTKVIGIPPIGGFAEFVVINKNLIIPVNEETVLYAIKSVATMKEGSTKSLLKVIHAITKKAIKKSI